MYVYCRIIYDGHKVNILQAVVYLHTMEYHSGIKKKKKELLKATTLMNLESIKWKKPPMKWQRMYGLFSQEYTEEANPQRQNAVCKLQGAREVGTRE